MKQWILMSAMVLAAIPGCGGGGGSSATGTLLVDTSETAIEQASGTGASMQAEGSVKENATAPDLDPYERKPLAREGRTINLGIAATTPLSINTELYVGNQMPNSVLGGTFFGDFSLLSLDPFAVSAKVTDPDGFFSPQALVAFATYPPAPYASIHLIGKTLTTAGTFTNKIGIKVCLDYGCQKTFIGSPYVIPYNVRVLRGLQLSQETVTIRSKFGGPMTVGSVVVTPPEGAPVSSVAVANDSYSPFIRGTLTDAGNGTARLTITNSSTGAPTGTYSAGLWISSSARSTNGFAPPSHLLRVNYIIETDPTLLYLVTPSNALSVLAVPTQVAPAQFRSTYFNVQAGATNQSLTYDGVELVLNPALEAAMPLDARAGLLKLIPNGSPPPPRTYLLNQQANWSSCSYDVGQTLHCLPAGRYPFKIHYTHRTYDDVATPFQIEGELVVGP